MQTIQVADGNNSLLGTLSISVQPAAATKLILTSPSSTPAGQAFGLAVSAWDAFNNIATGYLGTIVFGSTDVNATLPPSLVLTGGMTTLNAAVKLTTAGNQNLTVADIAAALTGSQKTIVVAAAAPSRLLLTAPGSVIAGAISTISVGVVDAFGNVAASYRGTVVFTSSDPNGMVPMNYVFVSGDAGTKTFTNGLTLKTTGVRSVSVSDIAASTASSTQSVIVNAAAVATLLLTGPSAVTAGSPAAFSVYALDNYNNLAVAYLGTLAVSSTDSQAVLPGNTVVTGSIASVPIALMQAGSQNVTVVDVANPALTASVNGVSVAAAAARRLALTMPMSTVAGATLASVVLAAQDSYGNLASSYSGTASLSYR